MSCTLLRLTRVGAATIWSVFLLLSTASVSAQLQLPFVTSWKTDNPGVSSNTSISIPTMGEGYDYDVDWNNDGFYDTLGVTGDITHDYGTPGVYTIRIRGHFPRIRFAGGGDAAKLTKILFWGDIEWESMEGAFDGCENLELYALDAPDLRRVTSARNMFRDCKAMNWHVNHWNVHSITDMHGMFRAAASFDHPLKNWDVSHVVDFSEMFMEAHSFDQSLKYWNVSSANDMTRMFAYASNFNQDIGSWETDNVTSMAGMFLAARQFDQDLYKWSTASVRNMSRMFEDASLFNGKISDWDVSRVTTMQRMFYGAKTFNRDLENWDVSGVTTMADMFRYTLNFNRPLNDWNTGNLTNISGMFYSAKAFNQDISGWDVSQVTQMKGAFAWTTQFDQDLSGWDVSSVTDMNGLFWGSAYDQDISNWNVASVTDMTDFLAKGQLSQEYYDQLLTRWVELDLQPNVRLDVGETNFCAGALAREELMTKHHWKITDGGAADVPPTPVCRDITVFLGSDGTVSIPADTLDGGSYDACNQTDFTVTASRTTFHCEDIGPVEVLFTVSDADGNQASCTATVTVEDGPMKIYNTPENITVAAQDDNCSAVVYWTEPHTNCRATLTASHHPGDRFSLGSTIVNYVANDGDGIPVVASFVVTVTTDLAVTGVQATDATCEGATDGGAALDISGGKLPYVYDWDTDGTGDFDDPRHLSELGVGTATVLVQDAAGCQVSATVEVTSKPVVFTSRTADIEVLTNTDHCGAVVEWTAPTVSCSAVTMVSNFVSGDTFPVGTTRVVYTFTDGKQNQISHGFNVTVRSDLRLVVEEIVPPSCYGGSNGEVLVGASGGSAPYTYDWSTDGSSTFDDPAAPSGMPAGIYPVRVRDSTGCIAEGTVRLTEPAPLELTATVVDTEGGKTVDLTVAGGTAPYRHQWTGLGIATEETDEDIEVAANGTFSVEVTDFEGCHATTEVQVDGLAEKCSDFNFEVFPNPTQGAFAVRFEKCAYPVPITVYDAFGKLIIETTSTDLATDLDFQELHRGLYYLKVDGKYEVTSRTVMVQ